MSHNETIRSGRLLAGDDLQCEDRFYLAICQVCLQLPYLCTPYHVQSPILKEALLLSLHYFLTDNSKRKALITSYLGEQKKKYCQPM